MLSGKMLPAPFVNPSFGFGGDTSAFFGAGGFGTGALGGGFPGVGGGFPEGGAGRNQGVAVVVEVSQVSAAKVAPLAPLEWEASRDWVSMVAWDRCETVAWVKCLASFVA